MSTECSYFYVKGNQRDETKNRRGGNGERRKEPRRGSMYKEQQESGQPPSKSRSELAHEGVDENNS